MIWLILAGVAYLGVVSFLRVMSDAHVDLENLQRDNVDWDEWGPQ